VIHRLSFRRVIRHWTLAAACGVSLAIAGIGCEKKVDPAAPAPAPTATPVAPGAVGVVDIDKIITTNNWAQEFKNDNEMAQNELKFQAESFIKQLNTLLNGKKDVIKATLKPALSPTELEDWTNNRNLDQFKNRMSKEQLQELGTMLYNYQLTLQNVQNQANGLLRNRQQTIVSSWLNNISPVIRRVAESKKVNIVFRKMPGNQDIIVWNENSLDITDSVLDDLSKSQIPRPQMPPAPKLDLPPIDLSSIPKVPASTTQPTTTATPPR
jgi:Skp family chaperone for outer membrane proteins